MGALPSPRAQSAKATFAGLLFLACLSGCAAAQPIVMDAPEYGVYRRARAARTLDERLTASREYISRYPEGVYSKEVRAFFSEVEPLYFEGSKGTVEGLEAYLRALPKGPHNEEASMLLRELRAVRRGERGDLAGAASATSLSVARETERRLAVQDRIGEWLSRWLAPRAFERPLIEADAQVIVPWSLALPWPRCERTDSGPDAPKGGPEGAARRCAKLLQLDYRAVLDGEPEERQALVEISVWEDEPGRPLQVVIGGPGLFLRLDETKTARVADPTDPETTLRGAQLAATLAETAFTDRISRDPACRKTSERAVLHLACNGISLELLGSALEGDDDRFVIRPMP